MTDSRDEHETYAHTESPIITRLQQQIAALTAERDEARDEVSLLRSTVTDRNIEIERLRKERNETNASLDALLLMQAAQAHGFDCCKEDGK